MLEEILYSTLNQSQLCKGSKKAIQSLSSVQSLHRVRLFATPQPKVQSLLHKTRSENRHIHTQNHIDN